MATNFVVIFLFKIIYFQIVALNYLVIREKTRLICEVTRCATARSWCTDIKFIFINECEWSSIRRHSYHKLFLRRSLLDPLAGAIILIKEKTMNLNIRFNDKYISEKKSIFFRNTLTKNFKGEKVKFDGNTRIPRGRKKD